MIPLGLSAPPVARRSWATAALLLVVAQVFVHVLLLRDGPAVPYCSDLFESAQAARARAGTVQGLVCEFGAVPDELRRGRRLLTLVTAAFVHTGWLHVLANLLFLAAFGPRVEEDLGHAGLLGLFLGGAVLSGVVHVLVVPDLTVPSIGASGGVAAVLGAHVLLAPGASVRVLVGPVPVRLPTRFVLGLWVGLQLLYTGLALRRASYPAVSYEVHVAGFAVGLAVVAVALGVRPHLRRWRPPQPVRLRDGATATARGAARGAGAPLRREAPVGAPAP